MAKGLFFLLFSIGIIVFFAWIKLNQEVQPLTKEQKKQALEQMLGRSVKGEKVIPTGEKIYEGKFLSLSYPAYAKAYDRDNPNITKNTKLLEYLRLDSEEPKFKFVVMVQGADSDAVLEEFSGVKVRRQDKLYQETSIVIDSREGTLFIKTKDGVDPASGGAERSSFFLINGKSYSFSITGVDASELEKVYEEIMKSVKF